MNFSKVIRNVTGIMAVIGFFLMLGAVGTSDYMDEIGVYYPIYKILPQMLIGIGLMLPSYFVFRDYDVDDEDDEDDWEDEIYQD